MPEYPGIDGSGFFARRGDQVYYFTALHCAAGTPHQSTPEFRTLLIPCRLEGETRGPQDFIQVDSAITIEQYVGASLDYRLDLVAFPVLEPRRARDRKHLLARSAKLPATDDWLERFLVTEAGAKALSRRGDLLAFGIGYPKSSPANNIAYKSGSVDTVVSSQLVVFSGNVAWSNTEHCLMLDQITWQDDPSGFSGSPVFAKLPSEHGPQFALIGMIICGSRKQINFIGPHSCGPADSHRLDA